MCVSVYRSVVAPRENRTAHAMHACIHNIMVVIVVNGGGGGEVVVAAPNHLGAKKKGKNMK